MSSWQQTAELLDSDKIKSLIEPENLRYLGAIDIFDAVDSTNTYLLNGAKANFTSGAVCFAEQQTAGRGRLGRDWFSPRSANIYCSLLWRFPVTSPDLSGLSLAIGVMVTEALTNYGIETGIELKWPNDVMCYGRKLAGILLERLPERDGQSAVVIGIGLNVSLPEHPDRVGWIDIAEITGDPVARNALAGLLLNALLAGLPVYEQQGLSAFLPRWRELNALSGKELVVQTPAEKWFGTMVAVTERGELVVRLVDGQLKTFPWGEVSVRTRSD